jgi:Protein of unknown function (DUF1194)
MSFAKLVTAFAILMMLSSAASAVEKVDLALVLAVDCSGSVDLREYHLQMDGIAAAFRDQAVIASALNGTRHKIAVNILTWGDPDEQKFESGWQIISSPQSAEDFAKLAMAFDRRVDGGTGIGNAISYGLTLLNSGEVSSPRRVIDVSGDGVESWELREPHFKLVDAQKLRAAAGVTVNGLAIQTDDKNLANYYRTYVAAGPESFVISVENYQDYADGIRRKLLQELNPNMASLLLHRVLN